MKRLMVCLCNFASVPDNSLNREYHRHGELNPRNIASVDYGSRASYREDYSSHGSGYSDIVPRGAPRVMGNRPYAGDVYGQLPERPSVAYRGDSHDYVPISGSKRPYLAPVSITLPSILLSSFSCFMFSPNPCLMSISFFLRIMPLLPILMQACATQGLV